MNIVLAIDDDPVMLEILENQLSQMRFRVFTEISARKGIETAKSLNPDVILLDLNMPGLTGFQVMEILVKDSITRNIPIIVLTSLGDRESVQNAVRFGIVDYIVKPHDRDNLARKIKSAVRYNTLKREELASDQTEKIHISHSSDTVLLSFQSRPGSRDFLMEAQKVFTPFFYKQNAKKNIVIDLRGLNEFQEADTRVMEALARHAGNHAINIIAGRHYGSIVENSTLPNNVNLFITFGDMEIFVHKKKYDSLKKDS